MSRSLKFTEDTVETEKLIRYNHFLDYTDYCEAQLLFPPDEDDHCYKCGKQLAPLTYLDPGYYYLPCWDCSSKRKAEREANIDGVVKAIHGFYSSILGDRYFHLFIVDDVYFKATLSHTYQVFKKILNSMETPSRNDIWFLDWNVGYPRIIAQENINGLKIVNLTSKYPVIESDKDRIRIGDYEIIFPEFVPYEFRHYSRYSILNKNGDRKSKRVRLGDKCLKLYNTNEPNTKSIFKILKNKEEVSFKDINYQDFVVIKLAIMRNKTFLRLIFDVLEELSKTVGTLRDSIFLKNSVVVNPKLTTDITLVWTCLSDNVNVNGMNISVL